MKKLIVALLVVLVSAVPSAQQTPTELVNTIKSSADLLLPMVAAAGFTASTAAELQTAMDGNAWPVILLKPGVVYSGNILAKPKATKTIVRGLVFDGRAAPGLSYPKIVALDPLKAALSVQPNAHDYTFVGLEFTGVNADRNVVEVGVGTTTLAAFPRNIVFDKVYIHGTVAPLGKRGIYFDVANGTVRDSHISGFVRQGEDSNAILGNGPGPYLIDGNYLEASGENIMFGGVDPVVPGLVPSDIIIRGNRLPKIAGYPGSIKNCIEFKNARRVLAEFNDCDAVPLDAQTGSVFLFTPRNQYGGCPWCQVTDILVRCNTIRGAAGAAFNLLGQDNINTSGPGARISIVDNLVLGGSIGVRMGDSVRDVTITGNVAIGLTNSFLSFYNTRPDGRDNARLIVTGNSTNAGAYGIVGDAVGLGINGLAAYAPAYVFSGNTIETTPYVTYPAGNTIVPAGTVAASAWTCPQ